jgi:hypothetical protein
MDKKDNVFSGEYARELGTDARPEPTEEKGQAQTVGGKTGYYDRCDKSKPYRITIKAREIKE